MSFLLTAITKCLGARYNKKITKNSPYPISREADIACYVLTELFNTKKTGKDLERILQDLVGTNGWTESLATRILGLLTLALDDGIRMSRSMKQAFTRALEEAVGFVSEHPVFTTVIALGILILLAPPALEALGFGELDPIEGSFAARWRSNFAEEVPVESLVSFFQRLGMTWR